MEERKIDRTGFVRPHLLAVIMTPVMVALVLLMSPGVADATLMTLTFDDGAYDESIVYPGGELHGPYDWVESNGIRASGFWATDVGTADAAFQLGHTHRVPNFSGRADGEFERMHSWTNDLQGLNISLESGASFDVVSINYAIHRRDSTNPASQRLDWANGPEDARLLLSTSFDPTVADLESQWTSFQIDDFGLPFYPWYTLEVSGFENVDNVLLSHTLGNVYVDSIVLKVHSASPMPEPGAAALFGIGITTIGASMRTRRAKRSESTRAL